MSGVVDGLASALGLPPGIEAIFKEFPLDHTGHVADCGYDSGHPDGEERSCGCGTLPRRLARIVAQERATALREAADEIARVRHNGLPEGLTSHPVSQSFEGWLCRRAEQIEKEA